MSQYKSIKILILDNSESDIALFDEIRKNTDEDVDIRICRSFDRGKKVLLGENYQPDIIFLDEALVRMSGEQFRAWLDKNELSCLKVVSLTANPKSCKKDDLIYLVKPLSPSTVAVIFMLIGAIKQVTDISGSISATGIV